MYWHRLCCHNRPPEDAGIVWSKYPVVEAIEKSLKKQDPKKMSFPAVPVLTLEDMRKQEQNARREEKKTQNELTDAGELNSWFFLHVEMFAHTLRLGFRSILYLVFKPSKFILRQRIPTQVKLTQISYKCSCVRSICWCWKRTNSLEKVKNRYTDRDICGT